MLDSFLMQHHVKSGLRRAKESSIAVCLLARDCARNLPKTLRAIARLSFAFKRAHCIAVENDSADATPRILQRWAAQDPARRALADPREFLAQAEQNAWNFEGGIADRSRDASTRHEDMRRRVMRIALVRDCALAAAERLHGELAAQTGAGFDYLLMCDADLQAIDVRGIISSLSSEFPSWHACAANGRGFYFHAAKNIFPMLQNGYHDTFALQPLYEDARPFDWQVDLRGRFSLLRKSSAPFRVNSAFGGLALYRYGAVASASYARACREDDCAFCEHVSFHRQLRENGFPDVYINPAMRAYYHNPAREWCAGLAKYLAKHLVKHLRKSILRRAPKNPQKNSFAPAEARP